MIMSNGDRLRKAVTRLQDGKKWIQGDLYRRGGYRCMLGAICNATQDNGVMYDKLEGDPAVTAVRQIIVEQFLERIDEEDDDISVTYTFNDNDKTTFDDVRVVLEKAAVMCDEILG